MAQRPVVWTRCSHRKKNLRTFRHYKTLVPKARQGHHLVTHSSPVPNQKCFHHFPPLDCFLFSKNPTAFPRMRTFMASKRFDNFQIFFCMSNFYIFVRFFNNFFDMFGDVFSPSFSTPQSCGCALLSFGTCLASKIFFYHHFFVSWRRNLQNYFFW